MDQLSNYELLALLSTHGGEAGSHFMNFLAIFSAYLVAAYLVGDKIGKATLVGLSVLYIVVVAMTASGVYVALCGAVDIANEVSVRNIAGTYHLRSAADLLSGDAGASIILLNPLVEIAACVGSIAFAFHHRTHARSKRASKVTLEADA